MAEINQFGSGGSGDAQRCARCEALLVDALDHTASAEDQLFFDRHLASCVGCSRMYMDAKRGAAWLEMLRDPRPQPTDTLLERILSQTSGASAPASGVRIQPSAVPPFAAPYPSPTTVAPNVLAFRPRNAASTFSQRLLQPRLAMTAAMAFFSIALTLNLVGIRVTELRSADLRPANIRRSFHAANAHVIRYYDNLRVVYELEARVHELQRSSESDPDATGSQSQPASKKPEEDSKPVKKPGPGTSLREPLVHDHRSMAALSDTPWTIQSSIFYFNSDKTVTQSKGDRS